MFGLDPASFILGVAAGMFLLFVLELIVRWANTLPERTPH